MSDNEKEIEILNSHVKGITKNIAEKQQKIVELFVVKKAFKSYIKQLQKNK